MNFIQAIDNLDHCNKSIITNIEARIAADNKTSLINSAYRLETIKRRCTEEIYNNLDSKVITINNYIFELRSEPPHLNFLRNYRWGFRRKLTPSSLHFSSPTA